MKLVECVNIFVMMHLWAKAGQIHVDIPVMVFTVRFLDLGVGQD